MNIKIRHSFVTVPTTFVAGISDANVWFCNTRNLDHGNLSGKLFSTDFPILNTRSALRESVWRESFWEKTKHKGEDCLNSDNTPMHVDPVLITARDFLRLQLH